MDVLQWLQIRGFDAAKAQSIVGTLDKSWERRLTSMETVVLGVPQCVPEAYARLPKTLAAATMPHTSPLFDVKGCKERWCFVEYEVDRSYRPLDCTGHYSPDRDPDEVNCGDAPQTFLGAICAVGAAMLQRGVCCAKLGVECIEVQRGATGRCRLLPVDTLRVAVSDMDCESALRHVLLGMLSSLPHWVKEDPLCVALVEALSHKRRRRDPDYTNGVAQCLRDTRARLGNCFSEERAFSPVTPKRIPRSVPSVAATSNIKSVSNGDADVGGDGADHLASFVPDSLLKLAPLESDDGDHDDQDGCRNKRSHEELEPAPRLLVELAKRVCPEAVADTAADGAFPMHSLVATLEVAFDALRRDMDGLRRELVSAQRQSDEIRGAALGFLDLYDAQDDEQADALAHLKDTVRRPDLKPPRNT